MQFGADVFCVSCGGRDKHQHSHGEQSPLDYSCRVTTLVECEIDPVHLFDPRPVVPRMFF
jgi:hypothetical protein